MTTVVLGVGTVPPVGKYRKLRTLYWSCVGSACVGWWETPPPNLLGELRKCPKFRAPDIYHDHAVGGSEAVIADLVRARVLPPRETFRVRDVPQEWVKAGLRRVEETKARRRIAPPSPEVCGLFEVRDVKPITRDGTRE